MLFQWKTSEANQLTQFYKSMLQHFLEVIVAYICAFGRELALFNNKKILIGTQTIFYKEWFQKGIFLVQELLQDNGHFLHSQSSSKSTRFDEFFICRLFPRNLSTFSIKQKKKKYIKVLFSLKMYSNSFSIPSKTFTKWKTETIIGF